MNFLKFSFVLVFFCFFSSFVFAINAPVVSSSTHPDQAKWYTSLSAYVSWPAIENASSYAYAYDSDSGTILGDTYKTTATSLTLQPKGNGTYYFHVKALGSFGSSDTAHFKIQIDNEGPTRPIPTAAAESNAIKLEWTLSEDVLSGVKGYEIYRNNLTNFTIRDQGVLKLGLIAGTSFLDTNNLEQGRTYFYKIAPVDNAGTRGNISAQVQATMPTYCDLNIRIAPVLSQDKKILLINISSVLPIYYSNLVVQTPSNEDIALFRDKSNYTSFDANLDLSNIQQGNLLLKLRAQEFYGDNCDQNKEFVFDTALPGIELLYPKNFREEFQGVVKLKAKAEDTGDFKSGVDSVEFFYEKNQNFIFIGKAEQDSNGIFVLDWNTLAFENNYYVLKVKAVDKAGNFFEKTKEIRIFNTVELTADANTMLERAALALKDLESKELLLASYGIVSNSFSDFKEKGLEELDSAKTALQDRLFDESKTYSGKAKDFFSKAISSIDLNVVAEDVFVFNNQQVQLLLEAAKIPQENIKDATFLIKQSKVARKLVVLKATDANSSVFRVGIVVSFDFSKTFLEDNNISSLQVIELIPKDFAADASKITSGKQFTVLESDPKIMFLLDKNFFDSGKELVYALKDSFSESQAMQFVSANIVNKFVAPPVLFNANTPIVTSPQLPAALLIGVILIVVIVGIVFFAFILKQVSKPKSALKKYNK